MSQYLIPNKKYQACKKGRKKMIKTDPEITELVDKNTNSYNDVFHGFKKLEDYM